MIETTGHTGRMCRGVTGLRLGSYSTPGVRKLSPLRKWGRNDPQSRRNAWLMTFSSLLPLALCPGVFPVFTDHMPLAVQWGWPIESTYSSQDRREGGGSNPLAVSWGPCQSGPLDGDISFQGTLLLTPLPWIPLWIQKVL